MTNTNSLTLRNLFSITLLLYLLPVNSMQAQAEEKSNAIPFAGIGWTAGGDIFATTASRENPSSGILNRDTQLSAGGELHVWFGEIWVLNKNWEIFLAMGYHNDARTFRGGSSNFGQITYDLIPTHRMDKLRFGAGLSYHTNIRHSETSTSTSNVVSTQDIAYQDTLGKVISIGYDFSKRGRIDLRYQSISYVTDSNLALAQNKELAANSTGLYLYITF